MKTVLGLSARDWARLYVVLAVTAATLAAAAWLRSMPASFADVIWPLQAALWMWRATED